MNIRVFHHHHLAAVLLTGTLAVVPAHGRDSSQALQADTTLSEVVRAALVTGGVGTESNTSIAVSAAHGAVNLSGWMRYTDDPQRVAKVVRGVDGVKTVTTNMRTWSSRTRP